MKKFNLALISLLLGPSVFAGPSGSFNGSLDSLDPNLIQKIGSYLTELKDLDGLRASCKTMQNQELLRKLKQRPYQIEIKRLIGDVVELPPGSFVMGSAEEEPNPWTNEKQRFVEIEEAYQMPVDDVTQEQYDRVMGEGKAAQTMNSEVYDSYLAGPKKPMGGLTDAEWDTYLLKLKDRLAVLWPIAYGKPAPVVDIPTLEEISYATTDPLPKGETREVVIMEENQPHAYKITAEHRKYPGTDDDSQAYRFVVYGRDERIGLADVDWVQANSRGFRNLTGNIKKRTNTFNGANRRVNFGCFWSAIHLQHCQTTWHSTSPDQDESTELGRVLSYIGNVRKGCRLVLRDP